MNNNEHIQEIEHLKNILFTTTNSLIQSIFGVQDLPPLFNDEKNELIYKVIREISYPNISQTKISEIIDELYNLYSDKEFRHLYSGIESTILQICKGEDTSKAEIIKENIEIICRNFFKKYADAYDLKTPLFKLYDYIMLALNRISYTNETVLDTQKTLLNKIDTIERKADDLCKNIDYAKNENIVHMVSILGIFSGIILAFFGGINMFTGMMANFDTENLYEYCLFAAILGGILFNSVIAMMFIITKFSNKSAQIFNKGSLFRNLIILVNIAVIGIIIALFIVTF